MSGGTRSTVLRNQDRDRNRNDDEPPHRLLQRKSCWKLSEIDVIKHAFWSSSSEIPPTIVMWWSAFRTSSSSRHRYSDVLLSPSKLMIGSVPSSVSLIQHMFLPMTELFSRYTSWKVLLFSGGRN